MPLYSKYFSVDSLSKLEEALTVEGSKIVYFNVRFPPGSQGFLKVALFYGQKKIYPFEEDEWLSGDNDVIQFEDEFELPETPCRLLVKAENDDDTYAHGFFLRLKTLPVEEGTKTRFRVTSDGFIEVET
jgi:hypothetical protein